MSNSYSTHAQAGLFAAILIVSVVVISVAFAGSAAATVESTDRTLDTTEVENGSTVTVTTTASFDNQTGDASIVETIDPALDADNVEVTSVSENHTQDAYQESTGTVISQWADVDSVELTYELTIPEDAAVNTTYTITGDADDREAEQGDVSIGSDNITVIEPEEEVDAPGDVTIPPEYADDDDDGSVGPSGLLDAGTDFTEDDLGIETLLDVGTAFQNS